MPTMEERNIVRKLEGMVGDWELLKKHEKNQTAHQKTKEATFQWMIDSLFNIKHKDSRFSRQNLSLIPGNSAQGIHGSGGQRTHQIREEAAVEK